MNLVLLLVLLQTLPMSISSTSTITSSSREQRRLNSRRPSTRRWTVCLQHASTMRLGRWQMTAAHLQVCWQRLWPQQLLQGQANPLPCPTSTISTSTQQNLV